MSSSPCMNVKPPHKRKASYWRLSGDGSDTRQRWVSAPIARCCGTIARCCGMLHLHSQSDGCTVANRSPTIHFMFRAAVLGQNWLCWSQLIVFENFFHIRFLRVAAMDPGSEFSAIVPRIGPRRPSKIAFRLSNGALPFCTFANQNWGQTGHS